MSKTIMEKLGLEPVRKLNKAICLKRSRKLLKDLKASAVPASLKAHARYYARWYSWLAANGGHRGKKSAA